MMRRAVVPGILVMALAAGCGASGSDGRAANPSPSPSPSFTPPPHVEADACRAKATAWFEISDTLSPHESMEYEQFDRKFTQLQAQVDDAMATRTPAVEDPIREAMYQFTLADTLWPHCSGGKCETTISQALSTAFAKLATAKAALDARR